MNDYGRFKKCENQVTAQSGLQNASQSDAGLLQMLSEFAPEDVLARTYFPNDGSTNVSKLLRMSLKVCWAPPQSGRARAVAPLALPVSAAG